MSPMIDRISALPDSLICHILSFLPTEQAAATSVLSKRWRPLWLRVTRLTFDDKRYVLKKGNYSRFIHMVYTAMLLRDGEQSIKLFSLRCQSSLCDLAMNTWLMAAKQRKVEHLRLFLPHTISFSFSVFSSTTLVELKLSGFCVKGLSSVSFPSLKILSLITLRFEVYWYIIEILSACPILEVLVMKYLTYIDPLAIVPSKHFQLPKLVRVRISSSRAYLQLKPLYNAKFLQIDLRMRMELPTDNLVNLTYLQLRFMGNYWDWLIKLLPYCPNLRRLAIEKIHVSSLFRSSDDKSWVQPQSVPKCILLRLKRFSVQNYEDMESEFQFAKYILLNAQVLRKVAICCTSSSDSQVKFQMIQKLTLCQRGSVLCQLRVE